jgi:hypothetical protein
MPRFSGMKRLPARQAEAFLANTGRVSGQPTSRGHGDAEAPLESNYGAVAQIKQAASPRCFGKLSMTIP